MLYLINLLATSLANPSTAVLLLLTSYPLTQALICLCLLNALLLCTLSLVRGLYAMLRPALRRSIYDFVSPPVLTFQANLGEGFKKRHSVTCSAIPLFVVYAGPMAIPGTSGVSGSLSAWALVAAGVLLGVVSTRVYLACTPLKATGGVRVPDTLTPGSHPEFATEAIRLWGQSAREYGEWVLSSVPHAPGRLCTFMRSSEYTATAVAHSARAQAQLNVRQDLVYVKTFADYMGACAKTTLAAVRTGGTPPDVALRHFIGTAQNTCAAIGRLSDRAVTTLAAAPAEPHPAEALLSTYNYAFGFQGRPLITPTAAPLFLQENTLKLSSNGSKLELTSELMQVTVTRLSALAFKVTPVPGRRGATVFRSTPTPEAERAVADGDFVSHDFISSLIEQDTVANLRYGVLFLLALSSLGVYSIILAGWSSNSKYAFIGALRSAAQMISYEVAISLIILPVVAFCGSLNLTMITYVQHITDWLLGPLLPIALLFLVAMLAETNRTPFDLPEAEAELVAGYNVDYSSLPFAMFFLGEYCNMILISTMFCLLFLSGGLNTAGLASAIVLSAKAAVTWIFFVLVRATLPRYRYDQLMDIGWKVFLPIAGSFLLFVFGVLVFGIALPLTNEVPLGLRVAFDDARTLSGALFGVAAHAFAV